MVNAQNFSFQSLSSTFSSQVLGGHSSVTILKQAKLPIFHKAAVYFPPTKSLFISFDQINDPSINSNKSTIFISQVSSLDTPNKVTVEATNVPNILFPELQLPLHHVTERQSGNRQLPCLPWPRQPCLRPARRCLLPQCLAALQCHKSDRRVWSTAIQFSE
jgi:hypothetical protein